MSLKEARQKEKRKRLRGMPRLLPRLERSGRCLARDQVLIGIAGVRGKDHALAAAMQKDEIMVGSSSEDDDDESDDDRIIRKERREEKRWTKLSGVASAPAL